MSTKHISPRRSQQTVDELVWYASYGSNLDSGRFTTYIQGGTPIGGHRTYAGCRDKTPPRASTTLHLPHSLYFAGKSLVWKNLEDEGQDEYESGMAFISILPTDDSNDWTMAKAYLITKSQLEDVTAQEGNVAFVEPLDLQALRQLGHLPTGGLSQHYDAFVYCGELDGYPIASFTSSHLLQPFAKPSLPYLRMICSGLAATHNLTATAAANYLITKPGVVNNYDRQFLAGLHPQTIGA